MTKPQSKSKKKKHHCPTMPDGQDNPNVFPYTVSCGEVGCEVKFVVFTQTYESNNLENVMSRHAAAVHPVAPPPAAAPPGSKRDKAEDVEKHVPSVDKGHHEMSKEEWRCWFDVWSWWRKKQPDHLDMTSTILSRFPKIRSEIAGTAGTDAMDELTLLDTIKGLVTKDSNVIRLRQKMQSMTQAYDESISSFAKRLDKAAVVCDFTKIVKSTCPECQHSFETEDSYTDLAVRDAFFLGLYDKDLLERLCYKFMKKIPSLNEIVQEAEGIESSRMNAARPSEPAVAAMSTYKKNMRMDQRRPMEQQKPAAGVRCFNCGKNGHIGRFCPQPNPYKGHICRACA